MTGPNRDIDDAALDALFAEARADDPVPTDALLARIAADAAMVQPAAERVQAAPRRGWLRQMVDGIGGWPALGGLVTATAAGVYIGISQPDLVGLTALGLETEDFVSTELLPGDDFFFGEG